MANKPSSSFQTVVAVPVKDYDKILKPSPFKDLSTEVIIWQKE